MEKDQVIVSRFVTLNVLKTTKQTSASFFNVAPTVFEKLFKILFEA